MDLPNGFIQPQKPQLPLPPNFHGNKRNKKPRIIPPERRKKVAQACDSCKKRKQKCNGLQPCELCMAKNFRCEYTIIDRRLLKPTKKEADERLKSYKTNNNGDCGAAPTIVKQQAQTQPYNPTNGVNQPAQPTYPANHISQSAPIAQSAPANQNIPINQNVTNTYSSPLENFRYPIRPPDNSAPQFNAVPQASDTPGIPQGLPNIRTTVAGPDNNPAHQTQNINFQNNQEIQPPYQNPSLFNRENNGNETPYLALKKESNTRVLFDKLGNLNYIGESSPSSYLLQCRKVFQKVLGPNAFSEDPDKFVMVEGPTTLKRPNGYQPQIPSRVYTDYLLKTYLNNSNNIVYILDEEVIKAKMNKVHTDPQNTSPKDFCLVNLIFAIASVFAKVELANNMFPFPPDQFIDPHVFYDYAMSILNNTADDGKLWLVEAYLLLFFFHQFNGRRNSAWVRLGISLRYAQALGLHRKYVNESFEDSIYVLHRRKLFRSLYILDRMSALFMGRPLTINDDDWDDSKMVRDIEDFPSKMLKVCELNGKILTKIYTNPSLNLSTALRLATELKIHFLSHPIKQLTPEDYSKPIDHEYFLPHITHLHGVMLMSRPFFHFIVLKKLGLVNYDERAKGLEHLNLFYRSCVNSALLVIKIIEYVYFQNVHPFKPLALISSLFHSGLIVGILLLLRLKGISDDAYDDCNTYSPQTKEKNANIPILMIKSLQTTIMLLEAYGKYDEPSMRYAKCLQRMLDVTNYETEAGLVNPSKEAGRLGGNYNSSSENYEDILKFQDWLLTILESEPTYMELGSSLGAGNQTFGNVYPAPNTANTTNFQGGPAQNYNDDFLKDIVGLNNLDPTDPLFLDDFLFNVLDNPKPL